MLGEALVFGGGGIPAAAAAPDVIESACVVSGRPSPRSKLL
jgi:hypothetical protein